MNLTQTQVLELLLRALPYPQHISEIDLSEPDAVRFTWRSDKFRVAWGSKFFVETRRDGLLHGDNLSVLVEALLMRAWLETPSTSYAATALVQP